MDFAVRTTQKPCEYSSAQRFEPINQAEPPEPPRPRLQLFVTLSASIVWLASEQRTSYFSEAASVCCAIVYRWVTKRNQPAIKSTRNVAIIDWR